MLKRPIPQHRVNHLLRAVAHRARPDLVARLLKQGGDPNAPVDDEEGEPMLRSFIGAVLWRHSPRSPDEQSRGLEALELILQAGAVWQPEERHIRWLRRDLAAGESKTVIRVVDLLRSYKAVSEECLHELTRTPPFGRCSTATRARRGIHLDYPIRRRLLHRFPRNRSLAVIGSGIGHRSS